MRNPEQHTTWRKMPQQPVTDAELDELVAFLQWTSAIDTQDWPPQDQKLRRVSLFRACPRPVRPAGGDGHLACAQLRGVVREFPWVPPHPAHPARRCFLGARIQGCLLRQVVWVVLLAAVRAPLDKCYHCYHSHAMAQLVVRKIEESVVARLRRRAARHGVSLEEEHRRILRDALLPGGGTGAMTLKEYLMDMPPGGDDAVFARPPATLRRVRL